MEELEIGDRIKIDCHGHLLHCLKGEIVDFASPYTFALPDGRMHAGTESKFVVKLDRAIRHIGVHGGPERKSQYVSVPEYAMVKIDAA